MDLGPTATSSVIYVDPLSAMAWLEQAFGLETVMILEGPDGSFVIAEMKFGDATIRIRGKSLDWRMSPKEIDGANTQSLEIRLQADLDSHCERARAAGAVIAYEPEDHFYGERQYTAVDPEGHHWGFTMRIREVSDEEMETAGLRVRHSL